MAGKKAQNGHPGRITAAMRQQWFYILRLTTSAVHKSNALHVFLMAHGIVKPHLSDCAAKKQIPIHPKSSNWTTDFSSSSKTLIPGLTILNPYSGPIDSRTCLVERTSLPPVRVTYKTWKIARNVDISEAMWAIMKSSLAKAARR